MKETQINIIGNILDSSGYSVHTRQLASALSKLTDVKLSTGIPPGGERLLTDKELESIKKPINRDINLIITSPIHWKMHLNAKRNWVFLVFEGDKIPKSFLQYCLDERIEYIFVPSEHTKQALENTLKDRIDVTRDYVKKKIKIIPHGVDLEKFYKKEIPHEKFTFVCNKGFRHLEDRGGIQYAIRAYFEEFKKEDNVELFVKLNPAYGVPNIPQLIEQLKPKDKELPPLKITADNIQYNGLVGFYNQGDVFLMPTRAEAFGIPGIEAMACGLPVITTNFGGQTDYCNNENSWLINGDLTEVTWELQYEGIKWLTPNITELRKVMREAYENKELLKQKSLNSLKTSKEWTWDITAKKIVDLI